MTKFVLMLSILAAGALMAVDDPATRAKPAIQPLQKDLIRTLEEAADVANALYKSARVESSAVLQAQRAFINATLDASETHQERIRVLESAVKMHQEFEAILETRKASALATPLDLLNAKAARIRAEIELGKENANDNPIAKPNGG